MKTPIVVEQKSVLEKWIDYVKVIKKEKEEREKKNEAFR